MKIVVLVKEVLDTYGDHPLNLETRVAQREDGERVLDEITERSLKMAIRFALVHPETEVVALSRGYFEGVQLSGVKLVPSAINEGSLAE